MQHLHKVGFILIIVGGLNWLLLGLTGWDIGQLFGGQGALISKVIYVVIGLAAVYEVATHKARCKECSASAKSPAMPS
jgi:uncharacterized protein